MNIDIYYLWMNIYIRWCMHILVCNNISMQSVSHPPCFFTSILSWSPSNYSHNYSYHQLELKIERLGVGANCELNKKLRNWADHIHFTKKYGKAIIIFHQNLSSSCKWKYATIQRKFLDLWKSKVPIAREPCGVVPAYTIIKTNCWCSKQHYIKL